MIHLTEMEENCRARAVDLILERRKEHCVFLDATILSHICSLMEMKHENGPKFTGYLINGIILSITIPLAKIYFMSHKPFHPLKSNRQKLEDFADFIESQNLRVV